MPILAIYALLWYIYASYTTRRVKWAICHKSFAHLSIFSMIITMFRIWSCWSWKLQVFPRQGAFSWTAQRGAGRWSLNFFYDTTLRGWNRIFLLGCLPLAFCCHAVRLCGSPLAEDHRAVKTEHKSSFAKIGYFSNTTVASFLRH